VNTKLYIFDWDGTLAEFKTGAILPNRKAKLATLPRNAHIAIASNQGGVGLRHWMQVDDFGDYSTYPQESTIRAMFTDVLEELEIEARVYLCFAYQSKKTGAWSPTPLNIPDDARARSCWQQSWRKPNAGMLLAAMEDFGVSPAETLMVGDWPEDREAAKAAGCAFQDADEFFGTDTIPF
jgi:D-glycero-D-manno-heptose 1,7-bisphosphate phosphatase